MRLILGIIVGVLIVFNWSSIKSYFDSSLAKQGVEATEKAASPAKADGAAPAPPPEAAKPMNLNDITEQRLKDIASGKGN